MNITFTPVSNVNAPINFSSNDKNSKDADLERLRTDLDTVLSDIYEKASENEISTDQFFLHLQQLRRERDAELGRFDIFG